MLRQRTSRIWAISAVEEETFRLNCLGKVLIDIYIYLVWLFHTYLIKIIHASRARDILSHTHMMPGNTVDFLYTDTSQHLCLYSSP